MALSSSIPWSQDELTKANINPRTLLATDYLNHFNEVIMIVDLIPEMPDCAEDLYEWNFLSYEAHFESSNLTQKSLICSAYQQAPSPGRPAFDETITHLKDKLEDLVARLQTAKCTEEMKFLCTNRSMGIHRLIEKAGGIVNGTEAVEVSPAAPSPDAADNRQDQIDALFA